MVYNTNAVSPARSRPSGPSGPSPTAHSRLPPADRSSGLAPLEVEIIDFFVQISRALGQPKSVAEIYGLLFVSATPLSMDDLIARLNLSKGSTSQGLRFLRNAGAVRMVYVPGQRAVRYEAVAELRNLATRFLRDQILPRLDDGLVRLEHAAALVKNLPAAERTRVHARMTMLHSWEKKTRRVLPVILKLLGA